MFQKIIILEGEYEVNGPIVLDWMNNSGTDDNTLAIARGRITIEGEGFGTRIRNEATYNGPIFQVNSYYNTLKNLSIITNGNNTGILITPTSSLDPRNNIFENLYIGTADMVTASSTGSGSISNSPTIPSSNVRTGISIRERNGAVAREIAFNRFKNITFNGLQIGLELVANTRLNHNYFENLSFNKVTVGVDFINQGSVGPDAHSDNVFSNLKFTETPKLFRNIRGRHNAFNDIYAPEGTITILEQAQHTTLKNATIPKSAIQDAGRYTQLINLSDIENRNFNYTLGNTRTYGTPSDTQIKGKLKVTAAFEDGTSSIPTSSNISNYLRCDGQGFAYWSPLVPDQDARVWNQTATNKINMDYFGITNSLNSTEGLYFYPTGKVKIGSEITELDSNSLLVDGNVSFRVYNTRGTIPTYDDTWDTKFMVKDGRTIIGNSTENYLDQIATFDESHKLFVNGNMRIRNELRINQTALPWPDYVFEKNYKLMPLLEIEKHINKEGRLPNMPAAAEIEKTGVPLATIITKQHEKIEELTLHLIEIQKEIEVLKEKQKNK